MDDVIVATTKNVNDDAIRDWGKKEGVTIYRGSENDILGRITESQKIMKSDLCVRVWGDCPLIDPYFIDQAIDLVEAGVDIALGPKTRTFPHGVAPHALKCDLLEAMNIWVNDPVHREHDTLALYEKPGQWSVAKLTAPPEWDCEGQRLQVDYHDDWRVVDTIYTYLGPGDDFGTGEIVDLLRAEPWIREINRECQDKPVR